MELESIKGELEQIIGNVPKTYALECYLFGSILKNATQVNDIDLLVIYEKQEELAALKSKLKPFSAANPLHLTCFTFTEEKELDFIKQQNAKRIY